MLLVYLLSNYGKEDDVKLTVESRRFVFESDQKSGQMAKIEIGALKLNLWIFWDTKLNLVVVNKWNMNWGEKRIHLALLLYKAKISFKKRSQ